MKNLFLIISIPFLFLLSSCQKDKLEDELHMDQTQVGWEKQELINMGFHDHDIEEFDEYFVVEGDIVINKSAFKGTYHIDEPGAVDFRQRRSKFIVDRNIVTDIRVQIGAGFNTYWQGLIRQALDDWNNAATPVFFREVTSNPHITIYDDTDLALSNSYRNLNQFTCGRGTFPDSDGNPGDVISMNTDIPAMSSDAERIFVITHEFGHNVGLAHTDGNHGSHITCTQSLDAASIMNGGTCGSTGPISPGDELALRKLYACSSWVGWTDANDLSLTGDANGDGSEDLVLINTSYTDGAVRVVDLTTGNTINSINHGTFGGWMDYPTDRVFLGDANGDGAEDLILINTSYTGGAVRAVDLVTGNDINLISHGALQGWMDITDKSFLGDANGDGAEDLILVNNNQSGTSINGAVLVLDLITGNTITTINHGSFQGWVNPTDRLFLGDANGDGREDLIFLNTSYTDGAFRVIDLVTGININKMSHSNPLAAFQGWMDTSDKSYSGDVNGDGRDDLILVNNNQTGTSINGAIRVVDLINENTITTINHGNFQGWMNPTDRLFVGDVNGDGNEDLVFQNTSYIDGALRMVNLMTGLNINSINHGTFGGWMDSPDRSHLCDVNGDGTKDFLLVNRDPNRCGGVVRTLDLITENDLLWVDYCD